MTSINLCKGRKRCEKQESEKPGSAANSTTTCRPIIYLDNAATTYPKPEAVYVRMDRFFRESGVTPDRGLHRLAGLATEQVALARKLVARLIGAPDASRVVFTSGATESLNLVLKGVLRPGDHVVTTSIEHNSVNRPLATLETSRHVEVIRVDPDAHGIVTAEAISARITPWTRLVVMTHASNVTGVVQPIEEVARLTREQGIRLVVDCAQTAGCWPVDVRVPGIDAVAFSAHKGLYGPPGVGVLWLSSALDPEPLIEGGTGSFSESNQQPRELPARYEAGTGNFVGIVGLAAGVESILDRGVDAIRDHHRGLIDLLIREAESIDGLTLYHAQSPLRTGVLSLNLKGYEPLDLAATLDHSFGIAVRPGLHCAPGAHRSLGTFPDGTVRVSVSALTTTAEVRSLLSALDKLAKGPLIGFSRDGCQSDFRNFVGEPLSATNPTRRR